MSLYRRVIAPVVVNAACSSSLLDHARTRACEGLSGTVVELGFGAGNNIGFYPSGVTKVLAVEPSGVAQRLAQRRIRRTSVEIEPVGLRGESLPLEDESCSFVLSTFTLCSVEDPAQVLAEVARVLTPQGSFHFAEHGLSPDDAVSRWQRRLDRFEQIVGDGCHLIRQPRELLVNAGFHFEWIEEGYVGGPKPWSYVSSGVARKLPVG